MRKIVCKDLCKNYKDVKALDGVNLELESGKIYGLIGPNGAGKTTLLSIISGQIPASSGAVTLDGEPIWEKQKQLDAICFSRELNVSAQNGVGALKIKDYLQAARSYFPNWNKEMEKQLVEKFRIPVKKQIGKVNKGMQSMITITVALASGAEFTFLDEPVAGLDVIAREEFYTMLVDEFMASGRTFVVSTHIIEEAASVFEETIIVDHGTILLKQNTDELVASAVLVSGHEDAVNGATRGLKVHHAQQMGRSKAVTVFLKKGETLRDGFDVDVQPVSLQKVFVALCGEE